MTNIVKISIEVNDIPHFLSTTTLSTTVWFTGCKLACKNCQNTSIIDEHIGLNIDNIKQKIKERRILTSWVNFLGGEPFFNDNSIKVLKELLQYSKSIGYKTFIYSGYEYCEIIQKLKDLFNEKEIDDFLNNVDYIKTGRYDLFSDKKEFDKSYFLETVNQKIVDRKGNKVYYFNLTDKQIILMTEGAKNDNCYKSYFDNNEHGTQTHLSTGVY